MINEIEQLQQSNIYRQLADRYDELYNLCITDEEKNELYWKTLKEAILNRYGNLKVFKDNTDYTLDDFIYDYMT